MKAPQQAISKEKFYSLVHGDEVLPKKAGDWKKVPGAKTDSSIDKKVIAHSGPQNESFEVRYSLEKKPVSQGIQVKVTYTGAPEKNDFKLPNEKAAKATTNEHGVLKVYSEKNYVVNEFKSTVDYKPSTVTVILENGVVIFANSHQADASQIKKVLMTFNLSKLAP